MTVLTQQRRVTVLMNFLAPYHLSSFLLLAQALEGLQVLLSTSMEPNRHWIPEWGELNVRLQKNITLRGKWEHPVGFRDDLFVQVPYDTYCILRKTKPDVIISTEVGVRSILAGIYRLLHPTSKLIYWLQISEHTEQGRGFFREVIRRFFIRRADAYFVNGESGRRYLSRFGIEGESVFRVPYPTDTDNFGVHNITRTAEDAHRLLYLGQLIERKGVIPFIYALIRWAHKNQNKQIEFMIVGSGKATQTIKALEYPRNLNVTLIDNQPYRNLPRIYEQAGVLIFPTLADEWGIVVNEALVSGVPVLGSIYSQAVQELVEERKTGWQFIPDEPESVYVAIDRMMNTAPEVLNTMRVACQRRHWNLGLKTL